MNQRRTEALVDALINLLGSASNPDGALHQIRNPIGLLSFSRPGKQELDSEGRRVFDSWLAGYKAATFDIDLKCSGKSRAGLKSDDKLSNLLGVFKVSEKLGQTQIVRYLRRALKDENISLNTPLSFFVEEEK